MRHHEGPLDMGWRDQTSKKSTDQFKRHQAREAARRDANSTRSKIAAGKRQRAAEARKKAKGS
jgi:hypothetical protein